MVILHLKFLDFANKFIIRYKLNVLSYYAQLIRENCIVVQGVVPRGAVSTVRELLVPESRKAEAKAEAEALPSVEIDMVNTFY